MKIVEGKQAVLKSYRTERDCVLPRRGQIALPLELTACPVREPQIVTCSSVTLSDAKIRRPIAYAPQEVAKITMRKPKDCESQTLREAGEIIRHVETQVPKDCVLRKVSEAEMYKPVECSTQEIPAVVVQSTTESVSYNDDIDINQLQTTKAQVIPATPELEQMMEETKPGMSRMKKKRWFADTILHITNSQ